MAHNIINEMEKTLHVSYHITGKDVDKISFRAYLDDLTQDYDFEVTAGHEQIYYIPSKPKGKTST